MRIFPFILIFLTTALSAQNAEYRLNQGDNYIFSYSLDQETVSETDQFSGNVSIDIKADLLLTVASIDSSNYIFNARYKNLKLGFISPQSEFSISSDAKEFSTIRSLLRMLEDQKFKIKMTNLGHFTEISGLDSIISNFYATEKISNKEDILIKTIGEAFGGSALQSIGNLAFYVYPQTKVERANFSYKINFNANLLELNNTLYYLNNHDNKLRIQGFGIIPEDITENSYGDFILITRISGNQTFDHLFEKEDGWIIEGMSKQRIGIIFELSGHPDFPDNIKMPSQTISEFRFKGSKIN